MASNFLPITSLDVPSLKESLKASLQSLPQYADYDFEGSNLSALLDLLAAAGFQHTFFTNMVGNEMFLDTALMRDSIISHAKELNYVPRSRVAATAIVRISVTAPDNPAAVFIPRYYPVTTNYGGTTFTFTTNEAVTVKNNGGQLMSDPITIYEGEIVTEWFEVAGQSRYTLESSSIDATSIAVEIVNSSNDSTSTPWRRAYDLFGIDSTSKVFFVQAGQNDQYEIVFGNGSLGSAPSAGNLIKVTYRITSANDSKGARVFAPGRVISGYSTIAVQTIQPAGGGAERETDQSIKLNAPKHFTTQKRAIVDVDYESLLRDNFPQLQSISVYGGEQATEKQYGKVFIVTKPYDGEITPATVKSAILTFLSDIVGMTTIPTLIDPVYLYLAVNSSVYYDDTVTSKSPSDIQSDVVQAIGAYNTTVLSDFNSDFRYSKLITDIDAADSSITSNETDVQIVFRVSPISDNPTSYAIELSNAIKPGTLISSIFQQQVDGSTYQSWLADNGSGVIHVYSKISGAASVIVQNLGTINYTTGNVSLTNLTVYDYPGSAISIYSSPVAKDVIVNRDKIIQISPADINVKVKQTTY